MLFGSLSWCRIGIVPPCLHCQLLVQHRFMFCHAPVLWFLGKLLGLLKGSPDLIPCKSAVSTGVAQAWHFPVNLHVPFEN